MGGTAKVVFNRHGLKTNGAYLIHFRVTINRKTDYVSSGIKIRKEFWSGKEYKWVKDSLPGAFEINNKLKEKLDEILHRIRLSELQGREFNLKTAKSTTNEQPIKLFNDFATLFIKKNRELEASTLKGYKTFVNHLNAYNSQLKFNQLSGSFILNFRDYLVLERKIKKSAAKKYMDCFASICKSAVTDGYLPKSANPFDEIESLGLQREKTNRTYLEIPEVKILMDLKIPSNYISLESHLKDFLFLVHTGLYFNDFKELTKSNILQSEEGIFLVSDRKKNDNTFYIPLYKFPFALKYLNENLLNNSDLIFPNRVSEQKMNLALKKIARLAGIEKNITIRVARHTFTQICISLGLQRQFVSKFLGHVRESSTQVYYDVSPSDIASRIRDFDFQKLGI